MTPEEFKLTTERTDVEDYGPVQERVRENKQDLYKIMAVFLMSSNGLDFMKKKLIYDPDPLKLMELDAKLSKELATFNDPEIFETIANDETLTRMLHYIVGMITEANELAFALFKGARNGLDITNISEEVGDSAFYSTCINRVLDLKIEDQMDKVDRKLKVRFPEKFSQDKANNRNVELERQELEK